MGSAGRAHPNRAAPGAGAAELASSNGLFCCATRHGLVLSASCESLGDQWGSLSEAMECVGNMKNLLCLLPGDSRSSPMRDTNLLSQTPRGEDQKCHRALHGC